MSSTWARILPLSDLSTTRWRHRSRTLLLVVAGMAGDPAAAQDELLRPGEAYVTRFSGVTSTTGTDGKPSAVINAEGTVGSIIDIRSPGRAPQGTHWVDEPQRKPVTASQVGQVFGVALDEQSAPNVFLTATAAFGLHRTADSSDWMDGMWGPGGPGGVYILDRTQGYEPRVLTQIALNGRENTGAGLGNIAFDRWNRQLFVSDLETGMIHRIGTDGADRGYYDHGTQGRARFFDVASKQTRSVAPITFDPSSSARVTDCPSDFASSPECWNIARSGRRIWGVGVWRNASSGETRLYYAVWSSPAFGNDAWARLPDEEAKRNSVWSVRLGPDGNFFPLDVRRELVLPDFFVKAEDIARAGYSSPVSDISFPVCGDKAVMLLAERGGMRNLGLTEDNPFAFPHEARALRYELYQDGEWRPVGRYDVGFYDRRNDGQPFMRANCAGGIAFGYDYDTSSWTTNQTPNQFVWITGDSLCSPDGPCNFEPSTATAQTEPSESAKPAARQADDADAAKDAAKEQGDDSEVHGLQGVREASYDEIAPAAAYADYPTNGTGPYPAVGPSQAYLIDTDINVDGSGNLIPDELTRNDATKIGDVAIFEICRQPAAKFAYSLPPVPPSTSSSTPPSTSEPDHSTEQSHFRYYSHGRQNSHFRWASHWPAMSHLRWNSLHDRWRSRIHEVQPSRVHNLYISFVHQVRPSYIHDRRRSLVHDIPWSRLHDTRPSKWHDLRRSAEHHRWISSRNHVPLGSHTVALSSQHHVPRGSHLVPLSTRRHNPPGSHVVAISRRTHTPASSKGHDQPKHHLTALSRRNHTPPGSHSADASKARTHHPQQHIDIAI